MNPPRVSDGTYIDFLIGTPKVASACEAARVHPDTPAAPAHDAFSRLLARLEPDSETLRKGVRPHGGRAGGIPIADDTVPDKPYAHETGLVGRFRSGEHRRVVRGIDPVTLAWGDGDAVYPVDYRLVDPAEAPGRNKNEHVRRMLATAKGRGFPPHYVCFDAWYSGKDNPKAVRTHGWHFLTRVRSDRPVDLDRTGNKPVSEQPVAATGTVVHVEGFGLVKAFRIVAPNGDTGTGSPTTWIGTTSPA